MSDASPLFRCVLVATDGSEASVQAARKAIALARALQVHVEVLAVVDVDYHAGIHLQEEVVEMEQTGHEALDQVEALGREAGTGVTKLLVKGEPGPTILRVAEERGCDLIVVGAHRMGRLERVLLGSVTEYVVQNASVPVLVVRQAPPHTAG